MQMARIRYLTVLTTPYVNPAKAVRASLAWRVAQFAHELSTFNAFSSAGISQAQVK